MCFGGGTPSYTKKDYGPLPSLGTGRTDETPIAPTAVAPVMRGGGDSSSTMDETMAAARKSRGPTRPRSRPSGLNTSRPSTNFKSPTGNSLLKKSYLSITSPFMRG